MTSETEMKQGIGCAQIVTFNQVKLLILSITQESTVIFGKQVTWPPEDWISRSSIW
jgi:hypothetical protein